MLNSFGFSNTSPLVSSDYVLSYLMNNLPSPFFYNEIDNCVDFEINHELSIPQEGLIPNQNDENNNNSNNNNNNNNDDYNTSNSYNNSNLTDVASNNLEVDHNLESSKCEVLNGIVEHGDMNHHIISLSTKKNSYSSKKDRHSKIWTSHGLRDRRIRLSLEVARPFFDLQDMLGSNIASKTVEWLLLHSSSAIDELIRSKSGCLNGVAYCALEDHDDDFDVQSMIKEARKETSKVKRSLKCVKKDGFKQKRMMTTKEDRKKARDKARKRTLEKFQRRGVKDYFVVVAGDCSNQSLNKSKLQAKLL